MKVITEHERIAIVTIAMITGVDLDKVAKAFLVHMNDLENWLVTDYYKEKR